MPRLAAALGLLLLVLTGCTSEPPPEEVRRSTDGGYQRPAVDQCALPFAERTTGWLCPVEPPG